MWLSRYASHGRSVSECRPYRSSERSHRSLQDVIFHSKPVPFKRPKATPILVIHQGIPLGEGGEDVV